MGELRPFSGAVEFQPGELETGAVIAVTESAKDGSVEQVSATPVLWNTPNAGAASLPTGPALADGEIVAVVTTPVEGDPDLQDVVVLDGEGAVGTQYIDDYGTADGGVLDIDVSDDRRTVLVAVSTSACTSEVRAYSADGFSHRVLGSGDHVALSPDGQWLAVSVDPECDGTDFVELRDPAGELPTRRQKVGDGRVGHLAWADTETLLYDVYEGDNQNVSLHAITGDSAQRRLTPPGGVEWSQPEREKDGDVRVYVSDGSIQYLDTSTWTASEMGLDAGMGVQSHADPGPVSYWVTPDGALHTSEGRIVRRDVVLIAS
jgi:hypothetical protein